jgi:hypothetical protein
LRKIFLAAIIVILFALPISAFAESPQLPLVPAPTQRKALILSPLEAYVPTAYSKNIQYFLTKAGYQITYLTNTAVTLDFLVNHFNDYDVVIWRTNVYEWAHQQYWYVGELYNSATAQKYSSDFAAGYLDNHNGILGMSIDFMSKHFTAGSLRNVKLAILISSASSTYANIFITAGVKAVVYCYSYFSLSYGNIDFVTGQLMSYLANGQDIGDAVSSTVVPYLTMQVHDPLDLVYFPPFWYLGDATVKIT